MNFPEEEPNQLPQPRRRRRYPVLVYRDRNGNHIANDIATAPKVELPLTPIVPSSITLPTSSPLSPHQATFAMFNHPVKKRFRPMHFPEEEPNQLPQPRRRRRYPVLVYRDRNGNHIANDIATAPKVELPLTPIVPLSVTLPISPIPQPDPEIFEETPKERNDEYPSPQHTPRKRTTASGYPPYHVSSCSPGPPAPQGTSRISTGQGAPQYTTQAVGQSSLHQSGQYVTQAVGHRTPEQSSQYVTHVVQNAPQKRDVYQSPPLESAEPRTVTPPQTVGSYPPGNVPATERIILAGKRRGTVEYWRSSLQMPQEKRVVKSVKALVEMVSDQPIAPRHGQQGIEIRSKEEIEQRKLQFLRDSEMRRLTTLAQSKFHMKMQNRGRMKLEQYVNSDPVTTAALDLIVTEFDLDRRVLSDNMDTRRNALYDMTNESLRILEALMSRISSHGGRRIWSMLTRFLSYESFVSTLPARE